MKSFIKKAFAVLLALCFMVPSVAVFANQVTEAELDAHIVELERYYDSITEEAENLFKQTYENFGEFSEEDVNAAGTGSKSMDNMIAALNALVGGSAANVPEPGAGWTGKSYWSLGGISAALQEMENVQKMHQILLERLITVAGSTRLEALKRFAADTKVQSTTALGVTSLYATQLKGQQTAAGQAGVLQNWFANYIYGYDNMIEYIIDYARTISNDNKKSPLGWDSFKTYDEMAGYTYFWCYGSGPYKESQRQRDLYVLMDMMTMANLYLKTQYVRADLPNDKRAELQALEKRMNEAAKQVIYLFGGYKVSDPKFAIYENKQTGEHMMLYRKFNYQANNIPTSLNKIANQMRNVFDDSRLKWSKWPYPARPNLHSFTELMNEPINTLVRERDGNTAHVINKEEMALIAEYAKAYNMPLDKFMTDYLGMYTDEFDGKREVLTDSKFSEAFYWHMEKDDFLFNEGVFIFGKLMDNVWFYPKSGPFGLARFFNINSANLKSLTFNEVMTRRYRTLTAEVHVTMDWLHPNQSIETSLPYVDKFGRDNKRSFFAIGYWKDDTYAFPDTIFKNLQTPTGDQVFALMVVKNGSKINYRDVRLDEFDEEEFPESPFQESRDRLYINDELITGEEGFTGISFMMNGRNYAEAHVFMNLIGGTEVTDGEGGIALTWNGITAFFDNSSKSYTVNDVAVETDSEALVAYDYAFIPIRFICDAFGIEIEYIAARREVHVRFSGTVTPPRTEEPTPMPGPEEPPTPMPGPEEPPTPMPEPEEDEAGILPMP